MAKRKEDPPPAGSPGWMATFGDLMNLLLCFFVLLFSMSTVDAEKFELVISSLQSSFSVLPQGGAAVFDGQMVSSGISQLEYLDSYFKEANSASEEESDVETEGKNDLKEEYEKLAMSESEQMGENLQELISNNGLAETIEVNVDANFVKLTLSGAMLFESGQSEIVADALPVVKKLGMILESYQDYVIDIEGHTDNIPIGNSSYEDNMVLSSYRAMSVMNYLLETTSLDPAKMKASGMGEYNPIADNSTLEGRARNRRVEVKIYNSF